RREARLSLLIIRGQAHEHTDPPHVLALLRTCGKRPGNGRTAQECDEVAPSHANCLLRASLSKGSVVRHSKIGLSMTALGHSRPRPSRPGPLAIRFAPKAAMRGCPRYVLRCLRVFIVAPPPARRSPFSQHIPISRTQRTVT